MKMKTNNEKKKVSLTIRPILFKINDLIQSVFSAFVGASKANSIFFSVDPKEMEKLVSDKLVTVMSIKR
jgi:hypothetical protein